MQLYLSIIIIPMNTLSYCLPLVCVIFTRYTFVLLFIRVIVYGSFLKKMLNILTLKTFLCGSIYTCKYSHIATRTSSVSDTFSSCDPFSAASCGDEVLYNNCPFPFSAMVKSSQIWKENITNKLTVIWIEINKIFVTYYDSAWRG